ncbi:hypothetical protein DUNSADRAFT_10861 [Dunaliella salina]|uniref:PCI domain-containing protein n=1 Tax=Dunaliella salina TaxID=3046 RepID=A0ABQ7HA07_DUNSA|nr:hypothetical protein DUNSADRAFT_10861 [Dunaliella salina]|eukprot:KAF5843686.1 hypothetical protein DUNSADRAFT_10861 [Dunaliella salina]
MEEAKSQQYVLLAKGAKGRAVAECIMKATAEPGLFGFRELMALPSVQELQSGDLAPYYKLLQMFAYGVWGDYKSSASSLPELNEQQCIKLKQLTLVSLALKIKVISYQMLQQQLEIPTVRQLEDFIITECFYTSIIAGKLDQKKACLQIHNSIGRDVRPEQLPELEAGLQNWVQAAEGVLESIENRIQYSAQAAEQYRQEREQVEAKAGAVKATLKAEPQEMVSRGDMQLDEGSFDLMDEDRMAGPSIIGERGDRTAGRPKRRLR